MKVILFDDAVVRQHLLPLTFTRPVADLRIGILTIAEKWARHLNAPVSFYTTEWLENKYLKAEGDLWINGALCPDKDLLFEINQLEPGQGLFHQGILLAAAVSESKFQPSDSERLTSIEYQSTITLIDRTWKIFRENADQIRSDFDLITAGRNSAVITDPHTVIYGIENLFIEEGVSVRAAMIDAQKGPVYLGRNSTVMEGALIKGAFALCEGAMVNMGAKIRGDSTVGPFSKVGGELSNSVMLSYSNKSHDGFLGNSVLGDWCNIGAGTNSSNLKNNYSDVKLYDYFDENFVDTGSLFCGLIMGDHSKCAINTTFNTGTVVGVSANIFGPGFPRTFIPSFSWGGSEGFSTNQLEKVYETARRAMGRRDQELTEIERAILQHVFSATTKYRGWKE